MVYRIHYIWFLQKFRCATPYLWKKFMQKIIAVICIMEPKKKIKKEDAKWMMLESKDIYIKFYETPWDQYLNLILFIEKRTWQLIESLFNFAFRYGRWNGTWVEWPWQPQEMTGWYDCGSLTWMAFGMNRLHLSPLLRLLHIFSLVLAVVFLYSLSRNQSCQSIPCDHEVQNKQKVD